MNVPIRMLGLATSIFWILLIAFIALAAYSVKDLSIDFGEPKYSLSSEGELNLALPLNIKNLGYYNLKDLHFLTALSDLEDFEISRSETIVPVVFCGKTTTITHNVTLDPSMLLERGHRYLFNDSDLNISFTAGLNFAELLPAEISTNFTFLWGAPLYNFAVEDPSFEGVNFTHVKVSAPISFENHAIFDLSGHLKLELYDEGNTLLTESQTLLSVPTHSSYDGSVELSLPLTALSSLAIQSGHFEVYFDLGILNYGPLVIPYG